MRWIVCVLLCSATARAESITFSVEGDTSQVCRVESQVTTKGKVFTNGGGGKTIDLDLDGKADFEFLERRLPPGGRDAQSLRAVREFQTAQTQTTVGGRATQVTLPRESSVVVASGQNAGVINYSLDVPLARESLDLLEIPGDPLVLTAVLPTTAVDENGTWNAPEWAAQMLGSVEAIEKATATGRLTKVTPQTASVELTGTVKGQRLGANCEVTITGSLEYDREANMISSAVLDYEVKSQVGAVTPGLDAKVQVRIRREVVKSPGRLTDELVNAIPVSPEAEQLDLVFDAAPWGLRLRHNRDWYLFHAVLEGSPQVAILRLIDRGSLIAQCNVSPISSVAPGQFTPLDQFEKDIRASLGDRLKQISAREELDIGDGMRVFRVVVEGEYSLKGTKGEELTIPTHWIYYLCAAPSGKQASFVFAVETQLLEQLGDKDETLVKSLQFVADRTPTPVRPVERTSRSKP